MKPITWREFTTRTPSDGEHQIIRYGRVRWLITVKSVHGGKRLFPAPKPKPKPPKPLTETEEAMTRLQLGDPSQMVGLLKGKKE